MKKLLYSVILIFGITSVVNALAPVTVVVRDDGSNLSVKLVNSKSGVEYYSANIDPTTENSSGYSTFVVGEDDPNWGNLTKSLSNNSNILLNIYDNGILIEQQRIDRLVKESAKSAQLPSNVNINNDLIVGNDLTIEGSTTLNGPVVVDGSSTFNGVVAYISNEFTSSTDVGYIVGNMFNFVGTMTTTVDVIADLNPNLPNNAYYTFANTTPDIPLSLIIPGQFYPLVINAGTHVTLYKTGDKFYISI